MIVLRTVGSPFQFEASGSLMLVGSAEYCHAQYRSLPPVAAAIACYEGTWVIHNLQAVSIQSNGIEIHGRSELHDQEVWQLGLVKFVVSLAKSPQTERPRSVRTPSCTLSLEGLDAPEQLRIATDTLVGTGHVCDVTASRGTGLAPRHCLITSFGQRWYVLDLTGRGGQRNGRNWKEICELKGEDRLSLGPLKMVVSLPERGRSTQPETKRERLSTSPSSELARRENRRKTETQGSATGSLTSTSQTPLKASVTAPSTGYSAGGSAAPSHRADSDHSGHRDQAASISDQGLRDTREFGQVSADTDPYMARTAEPSQSQPEPFHQPARPLVQAIYNQLKSRHTLHSSPKTTLPLLWQRWQTLSVSQEINRLFVEGQHERAIKLLVPLLEKDAWNRSLLLDFARMCDVMGLEDLCLYVLMLLHKLNREDVVVNRAIARLCRHLAVTDLRFYRRAAEHWRLVREACPAETIAIDQTLKDLDAEQALQMQQMGMGM